MRAARGGVAGALFAVVAAVVVVVVAAVVDGARGAQLLSVESSATSFTTTVALLDVASRARTLVGTVDGDAYASPLSQVAYNNDYELSVFAVDRQSRRWLHTFDTVTKAQTRVAVDDGTAPGARGSSQWFALHYIFSRLYALRVRNDARHSIELGRIDRSASTATFAPLLNITDAPGLNHSTAYHYATEPYSSVFDYNDGVLYVQLVDAQLSGVFQVVSVHWGAQPTFATSALPTTRPLQAMCSTYKIAAHADDVDHDVVARSSSSSPPPPLPRSLSTSSNFVGLTRSLSGGGAYELVVATQLAPPALTTVYTYPHMIFTGAFAFDESQNVLHTTMAEHVRRRDDEQFGGKVQLVSVNSLTGVPLAGGAWQVPESAGLFVYRA